VFNLRYSRYIMNTKKIIFLILIILVIGAGGWYGYGKYSDFAWLREMKKEADKFNTEQNRLKALIEADTYGGVTPQETLQMFIDAVEAGNYELASRYMSVSNQEAEKTSLLELENKGNLRSFLSLLENAQSDGEITEDSFRMKSKTELGPYYFIRFIKYPQGLWKINEI